MLRKLLLFGLIGVINTAVDWGAFWGIGAAVPAAAEAVWMAKAASYSLGVIASFVLNSTITFRAEYRVIREQDPRGGGRAFGRFWIVAMFSMLINSATYELVRGASYLDVLALITATVAAYLTGFFLNHYWTFRPGARATRQ
jgi:putative flippase GtrA